MFTLRSLLMLVAGVCLMPLGAWAEKPRQVILLIGDGMGVAHLTAAEMRKGRPLAVERSEAVGLMKVHSTDNVLTDSAAAGTALATGYKTKNRAVGLDPEGRPLKSLMELGQDRGLATGVVVTSSVTHATPAAFYAHQENRRMHPEIAQDLMRSRLDVVIGGGQRYIKLPKEDEAGKWGDFRVVNDLKAARELSSGRLLVLLAPEWLKPAMERGDLLLRGVKEAVRRLEKNRSGFLLMVEGSQIDLFSHKRETKKTVDEVIDFDQVVAYAYAYADAHPETLVIVTADHETGGFAVTGKDEQTGEPEGEWIWKRHTGAMVPVFARGPGAEAFTGVYENTEVFHKIVKVMGWKDAPLSP